MKNLILTIIVKMFMAFVAQTCVDDTTVILMNEDVYNSYENMDYEEILSYEKYLDKAEEQELTLVGYEFDNGSEFYVLDYDCNDFEFGIAVDENYNLVAYGISWY